MTVQERPSPARPEPGQTLLRVEMVGICGSDLHLFHGDLGPAHEGLLPRVMGHEFSAVVAEADPTGSGPPPATRVAVWPVLACGRCRPCRAERVNVCRRLRLVGVHQDGALQEELLVPTTSVVATTGLSARQTALVEPVSIGVHAVVRGRVAAGESVVVLGGGPIGVASALTARDRDAQVLVLDPVAGRRDLLAAVGLAVADPGSDLLDSAAAVHGGEEGVDVVIDTTGRAALLQSAMELAGHGGRLVVVGMTSASAPTSPGLLPVKELDVLGVSCCTRAEFAEAADLVRRNAEAADRLVSHVLPLDRVLDAFRLLDERPAEAFKVLVDLGDPGSAPDRSTDGQQTSRRPGGEDTA
jgi:threonine dehydrogenase-like Zn-dependent dehydrogenase